MTFFYYISSLAILLSTTSDQCRAFQSSPKQLVLNHGIFNREKPTFSTSLLHASRRSGAMSRKKKTDTNSNSSGGSGFGKSTTAVEDNISSPLDSSFSSDSSTSSSSTTSDNSDSNQSGIIYSRPALYDLAFGYRNYEEEVKFLLNSHEEFSSNDNINEQGVNIIELAAGPARHSITSLRHFSKKVSSATAVDISTDMMEYSNEVADEELGDAGFGGMRDNFHYINGDMRKLSSVEEQHYDDENKEKLLKKESYDSAWILLGSMQHLTTNDDVIACFKSAYDVLRPGGTMMIELPHPRETFTMVECTRNGWEVPLEDETGEEYGELKIIWGDDDDHFDPIRQVRNFTVVMDLSVDESTTEENDMSDSQSIKEVVPMRLFTYQEVDALSRICGFEVVKLYGALSDEIDINSEDEAFRLVCVLTKN